MPQVQNNLCNCSGLVKNIKAPPYPVSTVRQHSMPVIDHPILSVANKPHPVFLTPTKMPPTESPILFLWSLSAWATD